MPTAESSIKYTRCVPYPKFPIKYKKTEEKEKKFWIVNVEFSDYKIDKIVSSQEKCK